MCRHQLKRSYRIHPVRLSAYTMMPTKIVKKGKSKKAVSVVGGELERRRDWMERVGEDVHQLFTGVK
jgi:hypothetical protein